MTTDDADARSCVHRRLVPASPAQVFAAIASAPRLARWWGPAGFSSRVAQCDFRPGGDWRLTLVGPDGTEYPNHNRFVEIDAPSRVLIEHVSDEHHFLLEIRLEAQGAATSVGWRQTFDTVAHRQQVASFVEPANEQNLDRLAAEVARGG
ncbi:MAG: SRPBCC family protein [Rubrivivax sp.]